MRKSRAFAVYKVLIAALVLAAVGVQFANGMQRSGFSVANFFSFFTIESNIFAAIIFLVSSAKIWTGRPCPHLPLLRGAVTLYMATTGIVYSLLLSGLEDSLQTPIPWINFVLHYFFPVVAVIDWLIDRPGKRISYKQALLWLLFPVAYVVYSLARGPIVHWYPYPFLNPAKGGYAKVAVVSIGISVALLVLCALLAATSGKKAAVKKR